MREQLWRSGGRLLRSEDLPPAIAGRPVESQIVRLCEICDDKSGTKLKCTMLHLESLFPVLGTRTLRVTKEVPSPDCHQFRIHTKIFIENVIKCLLGNSIILSYAKCWKKLFEKKLWNIRWYRLCIITALKNGVFSRIVCLLISNWKQERTALNIHQNEFFHISHF